MRKMGGLWKKIPFTYAMFWIGSLAICGIPFFAGYYSKEAILAVAYNTPSTAGKFAFWMGAITAMLTAFYSFRLLFMTFHGKTRADHHTFDHAHESPLVMLIPLGVLAIGAIAAGWYGEEILHILSPDAAFWHGAIVATAPHNVMNKLNHQAEWIVPGAIVMAVIAGLIYIWKPVIASKLAHNLKPLYKFSLNKWYIDELYNAVFVHPTLKLASFFWHKIDSKLIDGMPNGAAVLSSKFGTGLKRFQTGFIYQYSLVMVVFMAAFISVYVVF